MEKIWQKLPILKPEPEQGRVPMESALLATGRVTEGWDKMNPKLRLYAFNQNAQVLSLSLSVSLSHSILLLFF